MRELVQARACSSSQLTVARQNLLDVSCSKVRFGHIPVEVCQTPEAMRVSGGPNGFNMILADIFLQLLPQKLGIILSGYRANCSGRYRVRINFSNFKIS